jgi:hypothetical protein
MQKHSDQDRAPVKRTSGIAPARNPGQNQMILAPLPQPNPVIFPGL